MLIKKICNKLFVAVVRLQGNIITSFIHLTNIDSYRFYKRNFLYKSGSFITGTVLNAWQILLQFFCICSFDSVKHDG